MAAVRVAINCASRTTLAMQGRPADMASSRILEDLHAGTAGRTAEHVEPQEGRHVGLEPYKSHGQAGIAINTP